MFHPQISLREGGDGARFLGRAWTLKTPVGIPRDRCMSAMMAGRAVFFPAMPHPSPCPDNYPRQPRSSRNNKDAGGWADATATSCLLRMHAITPGLKTCAIYLGFIQLKETTFLAASTYKWMKISLVWGGIDLWKNKTEDP